MWLPYLLTCEATMETPAPEEVPARLPSVHQLHSALVAATVLDTAGVEIAVVHQSYRKLPTGGIYHSDDLQHAEGLLIRCGLVRKQGSVLYPTRRLQNLLDLPVEESSQILLALAVQDTPPLWLYTAVREDAVWPELVADEDATVLAQVIPDPDEREAFLLSLANRFDASAAAQIGALGEEAVVSQARRELERAGRPDLAALVQRVSLISDQLGYDVIAPTVCGQPRRIEVKTARVPVRATVEFHLTRNEANVGLRDRCWTLVVCSSCGADSAEILGWCRIDAFLNSLPRDADLHGHWTTAKLFLELRTLQPGLPPYE
jgi:hypothetical protein